MKLTRFPRLLKISLAAAALLCLASAAHAGPEERQRAGQIRVATQNVFIGAEVLSIAQSASYCELIAAADDAVDQVLANDFQQRAAALARLLAAERPEVIGVQEAFMVIESDLFGVPFAVQDYLAILIGALAAEGVAYYAAETRTSTPITVPADDDRDCEDGDVFPAAADYLGTIIDRDVILCRADIACGDGASATFAVNAEAVTPAGLITIERGWVSTIATVKGRQFQVVNTHLEVSGSEDFRLVQFLQAAELVGVLDAMAANGLPQVVLGDFNSDETPGPFTCSIFGFCPSGYELMAADGFTDAWLARGGPPDPGFTCCQDEDLLNVDSDLDERIDQVWARGGVDHSGGPEVRGVRALVIGDQPEDRSEPDGLWPSDHAGVVADLVMRSPK